MAKEYLKLLKQKLKEQKSFVPKTSDGVRAWNTQLIKDIEAGIKRTEDDIRDLQRRLGHK